METARREEVIGEIRELAETAEKEWGRIRD